MVGEGVGMGSLPVMSFLNLRQESLGLFSSRFFRVALSFRHVEEQDRVKLK